MNDNKKQTMYQPASILRTAALLLTCTALAACGPKTSDRGFTDEERALIRPDGGPMRLLSVNDRNDSLLLRTQSKPLDDGMLHTEEFERLVAGMLATVRDPANEGVGIAAPQVGILRRLIAVQRFDKPGEPFELYVNPEITGYGDDTAAGQEGCLSIPGIVGTVVRPQEITVHYRTLRGSDTTERVTGYTAVIFQHETDHLNGILFTDRAVHTEQYCDTMTKEELMKKAIALSVANVAEGGGPFGAVIARNGRIVATGTNRVTAENDPTAHAEVQAIREAARRLGTFDLSGCEIYTSCEPCPMCLGAIYWARLDKVYFANGKEDAKAIGFDDSLIYDELALPRSERQLPSQELMRSEALEAFRLWSAKPDKTAY